MQYGTEVHRLRGHGRDFGADRRRQPAFRTIEGEHDLVAALAKIDRETASDAEGRGAVEKRRDPTILFPHLPVPYERRRPQRPSMRNARVDLDVALRVVFRDPLTRHRRPQEKALVVVELLARPDAVQKRLEAPRPHDLLEGTHKRAACAPRVDNRQQPRRQAKRFVRNRGFRFNRYQHDCFPPETHSSPLDRTRKSAKRVGSCAEYSPADAHRYGNYILYRTRFSVDN